MIENLYSKLDQIRSRLQKRVDAADDEGQWITTKAGHRIHLNESGSPDMGNQYVLATMGKPKDGAIPKKKIEVHSEMPFKITAENRDELAKALSSRKDKGVCFGGFYKVAQDASSSLKMATFFNPYTGAVFKHEVDDTDNDQVYYDSFNTELRKMPINEDAEWLWKRSTGQLQLGDKIKVVKGRTIPKGTTAKVTAIRPFKDKYKRWVADYAYLDNGQKINVKNIEIVDED